MKNDNLSHQGLTSKEVAERVANGKTNKTRDKNVKTYRKIFKDNLFTFFNFLMLGIAVLVTIAMISASIEAFKYDEVRSVGELFDKSYLRVNRITFIVIIFINAFIAIFQEIKSKRTIEKLKLLNSLTTVVIRDGEEIEINSSDIVKDEVYILSAGKQIPTDGVLLKGSIKVNESLLTGESNLILKKAGDTLMSGSFVVSGLATVKATEVGYDTYIMSLQEKAQEFKRPRSEMSKDLAAIIKMNTIFLVPIGIITFLRVFFDPDKGIETVDKSTKMFQFISETLEPAAAVMVGMIPSGLILLVSVTLAVSSVRLSKRKTLVNDLNSIETLARVDTLCFDKTGTLTDGTMDVKGTFFIGKEVDMPNIMGSMLYALQSDTNDTSIALRKEFPETEHFIAESVLPFSSERKFSAVKFKNGTTYLLGAPEYIMKTQRKNKMNIKINSEIARRSREGYRVLMLASTTQNLYDPNEVVSKVDMELLSLIFIQDHIREEAFDTIKWFRENYVDIKIISGDNILTVSHIASRVGVPNADKYISLEGISLE